MGDHRITLLAGDGIGPEVTEAAERVLGAASGRFGFGIAFERLPVGGEAIDRFGDPLPEATLAACLSSDGILLGAVGGPKWDAEPGPRRPEAGLLRLRRELGAFANLRPSFVPDALVDASPLKAERVRGVDLLVVRELIGGIYYGEPRGRDATGAFDTMRYSVPEVERIARVAFREARRRRNRVTSVDKANVLECSRLWRETVVRVHRDEFPDVELAHLYVDNAAMQIAVAPRQFDVILTGNLFGDILSDLSATLPGSLGLLPSASLGGTVGLFEPVHGSAPDIAGRGIANPVGCILCVAMLLDHLGEEAAAAAVRRGVDGALSAGLRTADLGGSARTLEVADAVAAAVLAEEIPHTVS
jgi:3-isopropylmalate dehydrogenase